MKATLFIVLLVCCTIADAQQQSFDIFSFTLPRGWKKERLENVMSLSTANSQTKAWALVGIIKSTASKGSIDDDFRSEWNSLIVKQYKQYGVSLQPLGIDTQTVKGWKVQTGLGKFIFNKDTASVLLTTFSNGTRCASLRIMSNTTNYGKVLEQFIASIQLPDASSLKENNTVTTTKTTAPTSIPVASGFQFNTTNFDDGWTSVVKEDWVEATKGSIKVLLHYPRAEEKNYYSQYDERVNVFWNLLVAPRYRNLRDYQSPTHIISSEPGYFAAGLLTDNATGKDHWVALFSKGKSGWIEVIAPDKKTFFDHFGVDRPDIYFSDWDRLVNLSGLNKFAVGENDLVGKWSNQFSGSTAYYSVYTGIYAGSSTYASAESFLFEKGKTYKWNLAAGKSGVNTTMQVDKASATGNWKLLNNWQIWFSDIERKQKTFNAHFSCIRGGRILWLQDVEYGGYTAYGKVSK